MTDVPLPYFIGKKLEIDYYPHLDGGCWRYESLRVLLKFCVSYCARDHSCSLLTSSGGKKQSSVQF